MHRTVSSTLLCSVALCLGFGIACSKSSSDAPTEKSAETPPATAKEPAKPAAPATQWYRATLDMGERVPALAFFLELPKNGKGAAKVVNGSETVEWKASVEGKQVVIEAPWNYESVIKASVADDGSLDGGWHRYTPLWGTVDLAFKATPIEAPAAEQRYPGDEAPTHPVDGYWELSFEHHGPGWAQLAQDGSVVTGVMRAGNLSDSRFLAGSVHGRELVVSQFNGNAGTVAAATVSEDGKTLTGTVSLQDRWVETFKGKRVDALPPGKSPARLRKGATKLSLPGMDGAPADKPTVVVMFASWCAGCNDAFPFITELAKKHPEVRFQGLAYELIEDEAEIARQLKVFRDKYGFEFDVRAVPTTPEKWPSDMPPELEGWDGLPIFAFIGKDGTVKHVWGGWFGPAAADQNQRLREQFEAWTAELARS